MAWLWNVRRPQEARDAGPALVYAGAGLAHPWRAGAGFSQEGR